LETRKVLNKCR